MKKTLMRLDLQALSKAEMEKREQNVLRGGATSCLCICPGVCPCKYAGTQSDPTDSFYGGSSIEANSEANAGIVVTNNAIPNKG